MMNQLASNYAYHPSAFDANQSYPPAGYSSGVPAGASGEEYYDQAQYGFQHARQPSQGSPYAGQPANGVNRQHQRTSSVLSAGAGGLMQQNGAYAVSQPDQRASFTSAPSPQSTPAPAFQTTTRTPPVQQTFSPPRHQSPHNAAANNLTPQPTTQYPMAAPPLPQSPGTNQQPSNAVLASPTTTTAPQSPSTSGNSTRDQARISLILSINQDLLSEISRLQSLSQGGAINPQQAAQLKAAGQDAKFASDDYIQLMRRVQGNLAYLMPKSGTSEAKLLPGPAFMQCPPQMPGLREKYEKLRELFPDWPGNDAKLMASMGIASAGGNAGGAGSPSVGGGQAQFYQQQQQQQQQQQSLQQHPQQVQLGQQQMQNANGGMNSFTT